MSHVYFGSSSSTPSLSLSEQSPVSGVEPASSLDSEAGIPRSKPEGFFRRQYSRFSSLFRRNVVQELHSVSTLAAAQNSCPGFHPIEDEKSGTYFQSQVQYSSNLFGRLFTKKVPVSSLPRAKQVELFQEAQCKTNEHIAEFLCYKKWFPPLPNDVYHLTQLDLSSDKIDGSNSHVMGNLKRDIFSHCHHLREILGDASYQEAWNSFKQKYRIQA